MPVWAPGGILGGGGPAFSQSFVSQAPAILWSHHVHEFLVTVASSRATRDQGTLRGGSEGPTQAGLSLYIFPRPLESFVWGINFMSETLHCLVCPSKAQILATQKLWFWKQSNLSHAFLVCFSFLGGAGQ